MAWLTCYDGRRQAKHIEHALTPHVRHRKQMQACVHVRCPRCKTTKLGRKGAAHIKEGLGSVRVSGHKDAVQGCVGGHKQLTPGPHSAQRLLHTQALVLRGT